MPLFRVKAGSIDGRVVYREIEADSREDLGVKLDNEGLYPIEVGGNALKGWLGRIRFSGKVKSEDFLVFNQGFATLLKAGVSILDALDTLKSGCRDVLLKHAIEEIAGAVRNGKSLSESMNERPDVFPPLYVATIAAGERTGDLIPSIKGHLEYQKQVELIRKKIFSAALYPSILALVSVVVVGFLMIFVVPTFASIYMDSSSNLPSATLVLMTFSTFLRNYFYFFILAGFVSVILFLYYRKTAAFRNFADDLKLKMPRIGSIYYGYAIAKFSRTLGMVLKAGVPLIDALKMSRKVLDNVVLERKMDEVIKRATEGASVSDVMAKTGFMPEITQRMFAIGEKTASLPMILDDIAEFLEGEVSHRVGIMTGLIEPALMIFMGFVIGTIVVLMYLPIFQLGSRV